MEPGNPDVRLRQELLNSIVHGFGILFGIICIPLLITHAVRSDNMAGIVGSGVYGFTFMMVFTFSTLYHGFQHAQVKQVMKVFDHISIYFLIAGTYTPLLLIYLNNNFGITLLSVLWSLTIAGTLFKIFYCGRWEVLSTIIYLAMGWIMLAGGQTFFLAMPADVVTLVLTGAGLYTLGVFFYLSDRYAFNHAIWHFLVLAAAICHYVAILLSI